jgi:uracil-DNA glycosylase
MNVRIHESWQKLLKDEFSKGYFQDLASYVRSEYLSQTIYPPPKWIFRAFDECPLDNLKVVVLGQDPYHTPGVANGLSFSSQVGNTTPPSLRNMYKEIQNEFGTPIPSSPDLARWANQGVLLLNATLTVRKGEAGSHQGRGWEEFTDSVIKLISNNKEHIVFMLWGNFAKQKESLINKEKHLILKSAHPSPFSANHGFFGNNHFKLCNEYLIKHNLSPIDWQLDFGSF